MKKRRSAPNRLLPLAFCRRAEHSASLHFSNIAENDVRHNRVVHRNFRSLEYVFSEYVFSSSFCHFIFLPLTVSAGFCNESASSKIAEYYLLFLSRGGKLEFFTGLSTDALCNYEGLFAFFETELT